MLDLKSAHLKLVQQILMRYVPDMTVWAYGSRTNGQSHEGSDLDLVVLNPHNPSLAQTNLDKLRDAFRESPLPILVDILDWARTPASFQNEIKKSHIAIFGKS